MEKLNIKIQKIIIEKGMKKKDVASACGWTPTTFSNKLTKNKWKSEDLQKLANALQTTIVVSYSPQEK